MATAAKIQVTRSSRVNSPKARASYPHIFKPTAFQGEGDPKYSISLLVPKAEKKFIEELRAAQDAAVKELYPTKVPTNFERWGITAQVQDKLVQAQPGIPVGALLAQGQVALGFQQLSEMMGVAGITVLGPLPRAVQVTTTFSGSVSVTSAQAQAVQALLRFWASEATAQIKLRHGLQAA